MSLKIAPKGPVQAPVPTEGLAFNVYDNPQILSSGPAFEVGLCVNMICIESVSVQLKPLSSSHIKSCVP